MRQVRLDDQFHRGHPIQIHFVIFDLAGGSRRTEIPLLPDDLLQLSTVRRGPSNCEFLQTSAGRLKKVQLYAMHRDGLIEDQADLLLAFLRRSPPWAAGSVKDGLDGKAGILGADFDGRNLSQIHPARAGSGFGSRATRTNNSLSHFSIVSD